MLFTFANALSDWKRFEAEAALWKPAGFDQDAELRLQYYLDQHLEDLKRELARRYPQTHATMTPVTVPFVKHIIREQSKVFLAAMKLDLAKEDEGEVDPKLATWWKETQERMGLGLRLKKVDAYTTLLRTAGLRIGFSGGRFTAHVVFPHHLRIVPDPAAPFDLDQAFGVAWEVASAGGIQGKGRRWEFCCARPGEERHLTLEVAGTGEETTVVVEEDEGDPLLSRSGHAIVPLVLFTAHTEELGPFTLEGADLIPSARALNVMLTDIHLVAETQGFGVMVISSPAGEDAPGTIVRAPNTAISLKGGTDAKFINANAPLADLVALVDTRLKQAAIFYGLPAGAVSLEARAAASGLALQIEMRPLLELRTDAIEVYRDPMRRLWEVIRATHNAFADAIPEAKEIPDDIEMRWTPGDIQTPSDFSQVLDDVVTKLKNRLCTRVEAIAELRGIGTEEAEKVIATIDAEKTEQAAPAEDEASLLALEMQRQRMKAPVEPDLEEPPVPPAG